MRNRILNVTANGNWQTLGPTENFPQNTLSVSFQARGSNDMYYKFAGQDGYWTVKDGHVRSITGKFDPGDLQVRGTNADVLEIECSTNGLSI